MKALFLRDYFYNDWSFLLNVCRVFFRICENLFKNYLLDRSLCCIVICDTLKLPLFRFALYLGVGKKLFMTNVIKVETCCRKFTEVCDELLDNLWKYMIR